MASTDELCIDLYLRDETSPAVEQQQCRVRSRLEGAFDPGTFSIHEHPHRVPADDGSPLFRRYAAARRWASETGVSLSPFFESREAYDPEAGCLREMLTLPVLWLTVGEASAIEATYPHVEEEVRTVSDAVTRLLESRPLREAAD